jgi:hypothetical protein
LQIHRCVRDVGSRLDVVIERHIRIISWLGGVLPAG